MQHDLFLLGNICSAFSRFEPQLLGWTGRKAASVAMLLRDVSGSSEVLFIERAADVRDPWSGHLAFPGGKIESGEDARQAAERETLEEIGVPLLPDQYVGQLSDITGSNLPVQVSCHVYSVESTVIATPNEEVNDLLWVPLHEVYSMERHVVSKVYFGENSLDVQSILLPCEGKPVLWGITYRLVMQLYEILMIQNKSNCNQEYLRYTHEVEYL